jgi:hypothetical protein
MAIEDRDYEYEIVTSDSLIEIAKKHGFTPDQKWARKIWEDSRNEGLYTDATMNDGTSVKRQLHLGNNRYREYVHGNDWNPQNSAYKNPGQIILYAGEKIWIPPEEEEEETPDERKLYELKDEDLVNGFTPETGKPYKLVFPSLTLKLEIDPSAAGSVGDKYILTSTDDDVWYNKTLVVKETKVDKVGFIELQYIGIRSDLNYTLKVEPESGDPYTLFKNVSYAILTKGEWGTFSDGSLSYEYEDDAENKDY